MKRPPSTFHLLPSSHSLKVAIVCDWLTGIGGAERVVLELHRLYPDAPIYTSQYDAEKLDWFVDADVRTGWLQKLPAGLKKFLPVLRAWYFGRLDLSGYDVVISSSGAEAKGIKTGPNTLHVNYCHSPTHYYWIRYDEYLAEPGFPLGLNWLARVGLKLLVGPLKRWDFKAAQRPDLMIANSTYTQSMIKKCYRRESTVIHPPVDIERFKLAGTPPLRHGFVTAGRQTPYKRIDLAVAACTQLNVPLVVIGNGPDHAKLKKLAGRSVIFLTRVPDEEIPTHFQSATGFIFPTNVEDFGVTGVEAMAAGTPVIAYKDGGPRDYIIPGKTGLFFDKQSVKSLMKTLQEFQTKSFDAATIRKSAEQFSTENFHKNIRNLVNEQKHYASREYHTTHS
jgi:glycosyltransferase involved in cell wall biosynthesis